MEPRSNEREKETLATDDPSPATPHGGFSGVQVGLVMAAGTLLGVILTAIATGLHAGELTAAGQHPLQTPRAAPMVFEDSVGSDICSIVEDGAGGVHIEGDDPAPCERFLWARYGEVDSAPDL